jgi:hypothetical protein
MSPTPTGLVWVSATVMAGSRLGGFRTW